MSLLQEQNDKNENNVQKLGVVNSRFANKVSADYAEEIEEYIYETEEDDSFEYVEIDESDPNYEILEDGDEVEEEPMFYNGNFPPPPMPFNIPSPVHSIPVMRFPRGVPMQGRPMLDPALREEFEEEIEFEQTEDDESLTSLEDYFQEEEIEVPAPAPISSMKTEAAEKMLEIGQQQEVVIRSGRFFWLLKVIFKWLISIAIVGALSAGCAYVVLSFFQTKSTNSTGVEVRDAPVGNFEWRLQDGQARSCLEDFYKAIGISKNYITATDVLMKGSVVFGKNSDTVYIVKKLAENKSFIKIGNGNMAKAYFIDGLYKNVNNMIDGGMSGRRKEMNKADSLILRALVLFDDSIFLRVFSRDFFSRKELEEISYEGEVTINGKDCRLIKVKERDNIDINFFFENKTSRLFKAEYVQNNQKVEVFFLDYKPIDDEQSRPFKRRILINSKPYAELNFDFIVRRDGLLFPN